MVQAIEKRRWTIVAIVPTVGLGLVNGLFKEVLYSYSVVLFWLQDFLHFVLLPLACLWLLAKRGGVYPKHYGFEGVGPKWTVTELISASVLICIVFWAAYDPVVGLFYRWFGEPQVTFSYAGTVPTQPLLGLLVALYLSITAAFTEEIVFRALPWFLCALIWKRPNIVLYAVGTGLLFGLSHLENGLHELPATAFLGVVVGYMYAKIVNIWPFIVGHFVTDMGAFYFS